MATADELLDAPSADSLLGPEPKTSLGGFQPQGTPQENITNAVLNASGPAGPIKTAMDLLKNRPTARRSLVEGTAMTAAAAPATAALAPMIAGGTAVQPEIAIPLMAGAAALSGVGNVVGGTVSDIMDNPERAHVAMKILFDPTKPLYQSLIQTAQQDPQAAIQLAKTELLKAGERFTSGAIAQMFALGIGGVVSSVGKGMGELASSVANKVSGIPNAVRESVQGSATPIPGAKEALQSGNYESDASMYSKGRVMEVLKGLQTKGLFSADAASKMIERNAVTSSKQLEDLTTEMSGGLTESIPPSELAKLIVQPKQALGEPIQKLISEKLYGDLSDQVSGPKQVFFRGDSTGGAQTPVEMRPGGSPVSTAGLKSIAQEVASSPLKNLAASVSTNLKNVVGSIMNLPDTLSFEEAHDARSLLLEAARDSGDSSLGALANRGSAAIDDSMELAARNAGPQAYKAWRNADAFYKAGKTTFNNNLTAKLIINDPGQATSIGRGILNNGNTEQIKQLYDVANRVQGLVENNPDEVAKLSSQNPMITPMIDNGAYKAENTMNLIRRGTLDDLFGPYRTVDSNTLSGEKINYQGILNELKPGGDNAESLAKMRVLFSPEQLDGVRQWATNGLRAAQENPGVNDRTIYVMSRILSGAIGGAVGTIGGAMIGHPAIGAGLGASLSEGATLLGEGKIAAYLLSNPDSAPLFKKGVELMGQKGAEAAKQGSDMMIKAAKRYVDNEFNNRGK